MRELHKHRENLYKLLAQLYLFEADNKMLAALKKLRFPEGSGKTEMEEGGRLITDCLFHAHDDLEEALAVDYARVFLAAGVAQGLAAFPYESVYASRKRLVMQEPGTHAALAYLKAGVKPKSGTFKVPEDHIGLELAFMARLCGAGDEEGQRAFFTTRLKDWYAAFCADVVKYAHTGFYKGVAKLTAGFLKMEEEFLTVEVKADV